MFYYPFYGEHELITSSVSNTRKTTHI